MHASSTGEHPSHDRSERVRHVVFDVARKRSQGQAIGDDTVLSQYPDLMPELADELDKLRRIGGALTQVDQLQYARALDRIEVDWAEDHGRREVDAPATDSRPSDSEVPARTIPNEKRREAIGHDTTDALAEIASREGSDDASREFASEEPIPETIGRYRVQELLGEGAFGRVYLARDHDLARYVAIKVPHAHQMTDSDEVQAYLTEARVVAGLDHPAIVPVFDVGRNDQGYCYVVSKLIPGSNLATRIRTSRLTQDEAVRIVVTVAEALQHAHAHGLVHRDIKPANILLDSAGQPYVADFGLAINDEDVGEGRSYAGTPAYMSPEQARGEAHRVDGRSDIFSLGVVLYELITGRRPFYSESYDELMRQVISSDPRPPRHWDGSISEELERICHKAISKRAADRYANAREMIEDLRHYLDGPSEPVALVDAAAAEDDEHSLLVVPKGLRPFDAQDAEYFLKLVPGPRDRNRLPESIRRWKNRIEDLDPHDTFAVGVLYGPSGCGKSSLVRAGLLPRLASQMNSIYVEATADDTENRILKRLARQYPELPASGDLAECLAAIRRGQGPAASQKVLLVLDQFEQWLQGKGESDRRRLVHALRQCDGERLQCLVLVRDDFWLALSRFMSELEIDLIQGHNAALVDLFDPSHARRVLAEFGRSFGRLPDNLGELNATQEAFLQHAVEGLAQDEKVVPVRLALFVEMVKGRTWTPAALRQFGGVAGVGVTFLEEAFSARTANPQYRSHEQAARAVLEALLPARGSNIKGRFLSYPELLDISGYGRKPQSFKALMRILDAETRLLTPTDPAALDPESVPSAPGQRYYQLTHDYLVPSLRQWLRKKQKSTRAGRTELRLAERSAMWNARPERRQLPSMWEWTAIRWFTRPNQWTTAQRQMMRVATRHHMITLTCLFLLVLAFLFNGVEVTALARNLLMRFRASCAVLWLVIDREETVWRLLKQTPDSTLRTRVIHGVSPLWASPDGVIEQLRQQEDDSVRRAMLLLAGEIVGDPKDRSTTWVALLSEEPPPPFIQEILRLYSDAPDPGVHAAAEWTLRRYGRDEQLTRISYRLRSPDIRNERQWYINQLGHALVVVPGFTHFLMGTPSSLDSDRDDERQHTRRIPRNFCLADKETTVEQFQQFLRANPRLDHPHRNRITDPPQAPQVDVSWYDAVAYCNWLSKEESIPQDQWCYLKNDDGQYAAGMKLAGNYLERRGYRLPTEAEWEYACRAQTTTVRYFGSTESYLEKYAVVRPTSGNRRDLVGGRKPNDFGLFDMHGNVSEWCQDRYGAYSQYESGAPWGDTGGEVSDGVPRTMRGGSYQDTAARVRCAARDRLSPSQRGPTIGFRVARSYP